MVKNKTSKIIWFTGMSGVGKTFYTNYLNKKLCKRKYKINILDGDNIRNKYNAPIGFSYDEIKKNNLFIFNICKNEYRKYDVTIVSVISPYEKIRKLIKDKFKDNIYFIYIKASIKSLKKRDTKNLYSNADKNKITNLIGYSKNSRYEIPIKPDLILNTSCDFDPKINYKILDDFLKEKIYERR